MDRLLTGARAGESRVLLVRGDAGVGKTALLEYVADQATGCRVVRAAGVESEMELAYAGLHQLCAPMLELRDRLPVPQRDALEAAFGLGATSTPDRFFVGLAVLGLLSEAADERPLVCIVDDVQWLDEASARGLAFVARRLSMEAVALVLAARGEEHDFGGVPELLLEGLSEDDSRTLLDSAVRGPLDPAIRDRVVAEAHGNPLALLELPRGFSPAELAGGYGLSDPSALAGRIEGSFLRRLDALPVASRRWLLLAAAEPLGDVVLVRRAAERLAIGPDARWPADAAALCEFGVSVRFRHPLVRSAVYRAASVEERQAVHRALAEVIDPAVDPDRRAWHRAHGAAGPDEDIAAELERSAGRAQARGGIAAAAAFLERAAALSPGPAPRAARLLAAAQAKLQAGAAESALTLLASAEAGPLDELQQARARLLRAQVSFAAGGEDAAALLLVAARRLEPLDIHLARETYLDALCATLFSGPSPGGPRMRDVAEAALGAIRAPARPRPADLLLDGLTTYVLDGFPAALPTLREALHAFDRDELSLVEGLAWGWLASHIASTLWEHDLQHALVTRHVQLARDAGAVVRLTLMLQQLAGLRMRSGERAAAAAAIEELGAAVEVTHGGDTAPMLALALAAYRGREAEFVALLDAHAAQLPTRGIGLVTVRWAHTLLYNGLGRFSEALRAAESAYQDPEPIDNSAWTLHELIEGAVLSGRPHAAADAMRRLSEMARASGTDWALGLEARSRALLSDAASAEPLYREAIERLDGLGTQVEHARAQLIYGEWLRRAGRRAEARHPLRAAHERLTAMGVEAFAGRAARELRASGGAVVKAPVEASDALTPQETQIARLARAGLSNPEIGARLFLSPRTVQYHLRKVFAKLGISSRKQLADQLPEQEYGAEAV